MQECLGRLLIVLCTSPPGHTLSCSRVRVCLSGPRGPWALARATAVMLLGGGRSEGKLCRSAWGLFRGPIELS